MERSYIPSSVLVVLNTRIIGNANRFLGIPSTDGRGPSVSANTSVAVSANALDVEACGEFVKLFMSVEMQDKIATDGHFVLSREAFKKSAAAALEYTNSERFYYANNDQFYDAYRITVPDKSIESWTYSFRRVLQRRQ